jgi:hypothetical protein
MLRLAFQRVSQLAGSRSQCDAQPPLVVVQVRTRSRLAYAESPHSGARSRFRSRSATLHGSLEFPAHRLCQHCHNKPPQMISEPCLPTAADRTERNRSMY